MGTPWVSLLQSSEHFPSYARAGFKLHIFFPNIKFTLSSVYKYECISITEKLQNSEEYEVGLESPKHPSLQM